MSHMQASTSGVQVQADPKELTIHCLLCHGDIDATMFEHSTCEVKHEPEPKSKCTTLKTTGLSMVICYTRCCTAVQTTTTTESGARTEDTIEYPFGDICYSGPHVSDPCCATRLYNGVSLTSCRAVRCANYQHGDRNRLREEFTDDESTAMLSQWVYEDAERGLSYQEELDAAVGVGLLGIEEWRDRPDSPLR